MSSRRKFIHQSSALIGGGLLASSLQHPAFAILKNRVAPSDQFNIGVIGINGMGWTNMKAALNIPGVKLLALCDVDRNVLDKRLAELKDLQVDAGKVKTYNDYRQLLENKDLH